MITDRDPVSRRDRRPMTARWCRIPTPKVGAWIVGSVGSVIADTWNGSATGQRIGAVTRISPIESERIGEHILEEDGVDACHVEHVEIHRVVIDDRSANR